MKLLIAFPLLVLFVGVVVAELGTTCTSSDDCKEGECCVNLHAFTSNRCRKMREEGDFCFTKDHIQHDEQGVYRFMCPCPDDLDCIPEEETEKDGVKIIRNSRCKSKS